MDFAVLAEPDRERGRGYARLVLQGPLPADFAPSFLIKRPGSGANHLGPSGWQTAEHFWLPESLSTMSEGAVLGIGPDIVRHMENGTYRFGFVAGPGQPSSETTVVWRDIPGPTNVDTGAGIRRRRGGVSIGDPQQTRSSDVVPKQEARDQTSETESALARADTVARDSTGDESDADTGTGNETVMPQPRRRSWAWIAAALLVLAAGGFALWNFSRVPQLHPAEGEKTAARNSEHNKAANRAERPALDQARQALSDPNLTADNAVALARKLAPQRNGSDAAFLLWDYAASLGNAQAALELAAYYDPSRPAAGSIAKNGMQAVKWYRKAQTGGIAEAGQRLDALRAWAGDTANAANPEAARAAEALGANGSREENAP